MRPTRKPGLTNDARAVLLQAILKTDQIPNPLIFMRNDLRKAQFDKGRERLAAMQLLVGESDILTEEGAELARQLQENDARLLEGIRFDERAAAISARGGRDTELVDDEWFETEIDGEPVFTNGKFLMLGRAPSEERMRKPPSPSGVKEGWEYCLEGNPQPIFPVAYSEVDGYRWRYRIVHFSNGSSLCCEIYNFIVNRYPDARWMQSEERKNGRAARGFNVYSGERRVAIAGVNSTTPSEKIQEIIEAATRPVVKVAEPVREPVQLAAPVAPIETLKATQLPFPFELAA
jgi:hypothetical protein